MLGLVAQFSPSFLRNDIITVTVTYRGKTISMLNVPGNAFATKNTPTDKIMSMIKNYISAGKLMSMGITVVGRYLKGNIISL